MNYNLFKSQFLDCTGLLSWDSMDKQVKQDLKNNTCRILGEGKNATYLLTDLNNYCSELLDLYQKANEHQKMVSNKDLKHMHVYLSSTSEAKTFGRHSKGVNTLLVQSVGKMSYKFDSGETIILAPGDGIFIPKHMYHDPIPIEPRITISFSWD